MDLPAPIQRAFDRFKDASLRLGRGVQNVVLTTLLFLLYYLGVGLTRVMATLMFRRYLKLLDPPADADSYWIDAKGYSPDPDDLLRQY